LSVFFFFVVVFVFVFSEPAPDNVC